jgi:hypothetical protein
MPQVCSLECLGGAKCAYASSPCCLLSVCDRVAAVLSASEALTPTSGRRVVVALYWCWFVQRKRNRFF